MARLLRFLAFLTAAAAAATESYPLHEPNRTAVRLLQQLANPMQAQLQVGSGAFFSDNQTINLAAGVEYNQTVVDAVTGTFGSPSLPRFRLMPKNGNCKTDALGSSSVAAPYSDSTGSVSVTIEDSNGTTGRIARAPHVLKFHMGGVFQLCYSDEGSFAVNHIDKFNIDLAVAGVFDGCTTDNCLAQLPYNCHVLKNEQSANGSCVLNFDRTGQGHTGTAGLGTWTPAFAEAYDADGRSTGLTSQACANSSESADSKYIGTDGTDRFIETASNKITLPQTYGTLSGNTFKAFTIAACYCPSYSGCDAHDDFVQQIGIVYYFLSKVCVDAACATDYTGALPKQRFMLKVECPPGGCSATSENRLKIVNSDASNDKPSWDSDNGCRTATQSGTLWPSGICASATDCSMNGGARQDYKVFGAFYFTADTDGLAYGAERYDLRNGHTSQLLDVCFCESACTTNTSWFKVGKLRSAVWRMVGHTNPGQSDDIKAIELAGQGGIVGFVRSVADANSLGMGEAGVLKLLDDGDLAIDGAGCAAGSYDSNMVTGPSSPANAFNYYRGSTILANKLVFNGGVASRTITVQRPGIFAICYCDLATSGGCSDQSRWHLAAHMTIRGPAPSQSWTLSVGVASRLEYRGWGLEKTNILRLVGPEVSCTANNGNPGGQDPVVHIGCPSACQELRNTPGQETSITTQIAASDSTGCNAQHSSCSTSYVTAIDTTTLASSTHIHQSRTLLTFSASPGLDDGDTISLGDQLTGGTVEQRATMRGVFPFADQGTYLVGHKVTRHSGGGSNVYQVKVGWLNGSTPSFGVTSNQGTWKRHNRGTTKEELLSVAERRNLKLCWSPAAGTPFLAEVGSVSFLEPAAMPTAAVSLGSTQADVAVPVVISFTTGSGGGRYLSTAGVMQLRFVVVATAYFDFRFVDGSSINSATEVTRAQATRVVCGRLFAELWSSDGRGFPTPQGCYYGPAYQRQGVGLREFFVLFEAKAGLAPHVRYELVVTAVAKQGAQAGEEALQIFAMDDVAEQPYLAVELGRARLANTVGAAAGATAVVPKLNTLQLLAGGTASGLVELGTEPLQLRVTGSNTHPVTAGAVLRLLFRPLTVWSLGPSCIATCTAAAQNETCGQVQSCRGDSIVAGGRKNVVHLVLPADLTPITGAVTPVLSLWALKQPEYSFFPTKLGVQLTGQHGLSPQYKEVEGAQLYSPRSGSATALASLVLTDGNTKPFAGDQGNELYVRLVFRATLLGSAGGASKLTLSLPTGYTCTAAIAVMQLRTFDLEAQPRRGGKLPASSGPASPDGSWAFNGTTCTFTFAANIAVYAGMALYAGLSVNNPSTPLPTQSAANKWTFRLTASDGAGGSTALPDVSLSTPSGNAEAERLASNVAVLGRLTETVLQPSALFPRASQMLRLFFRTEQSVGPLGQVVLDAPPGFDFASPCTASDLDGASAGAYGTGQTQKLPGIGSCLGQVARSTVGLHDRAVVQANGRLKAGVRYGLQVSVRNSAASSFSDVSLTGWALSLTTTSSGTIDALRGVLQFNPHDGAGLAWGLYSKQLQANIAMSSLLPRSVSAGDATVTMFPLHLNSNGVAARFRVTAPAGYQWNISGAAGNISGATADFPGGLPQLNASDSVLEWAAATYSPNETYGFTCLISVPDATPATSSNAFFLELGDWSSGDISQRHAAGVVDAQAVRALSDGALAASQYAVGAAVVLTIHFRTVTALAGGGGLLLLSPEGFDVAANPAVCNVVMAMDANVATLPSVANVSCTAQAVNGNVEFEVRVGDAGLPPGFYRLGVSGAVNPNSSSTNEANWTLFSLLNITDRASVADRQLSLPGYAISKRMTRAFLVPLSPAQSVALQQTHRPGQTTRLVFAMELAGTAAVQAEMVLRGPHGTVFREDCSAGVKTASSKVFGMANLWDSSTYTTWPGAVQVLSCRGEANTARLTLSPGLQGAQLYAWQMEIFSTPQVPPTENTWSVDFNGESSLAFASFGLLTFTDLLLAPVSVARSSVGIISGTPLTITFRPRSAVVGGLVKLLAPATFQFAHTSGACMASLQRFLNNGGSSSYAFAAGDIACRVDPRLPWVMMLDLAAGVTLQAGALHRLTTMVSNPKARTKPQLWVLQSFSSGAASATSALDEASWLGYNVVEAMTLWSMSLVGAAANAQNQIRGLQPVRLRLLAVTPEALKPGDVLRVLAPNGFNLVDGQMPNNCDSFSWVDDVSASGGLLVSTLNGIAVVCEAPSTVRITYSGTSDAAAGSQLAFYINSTNPRVTPNWYDNFWQISHLRSQNILVAGIATGYEIVPQVEAFSVSLAGSLMLAQSISALNFTFRTVHNCSVIRISADAPAGFNFAAAELMDARSSVPGGSDLALPLSASISSSLSLSSRRLQFAQTSAGSNVVHITTVVSAEQLVLFSFGKVKLAATGGRTRWTVQTFQGDARLDEVRADGFRLPGSIAVKTRALRNELDVRHPSSLNLTSPEITALAAWTPRARSPAVLDVAFTTADNAAASEELVLTAPSGYVLQSGGLQLNKVSSSGIPTPIPVAEIEVRNTVARVRLLQTLVPAYRYTLVAYLTTGPVTSSPGPWRIDVRDGEPLPKLTNDAQTPGFRLSEIFKLEVQAEHAPPAATFPVQLTLSFGAATPDLLRLLLPPTYRAPDNCTATDSVHCKTSKKSGGQTSLHITQPNQGDTFAGDVAITVVIISPEVQPASQAWMLEGLETVASVGGGSSLEQVGWAAYPAGLLLTPARNAIVQYGAVLQTTTIFMASFDVVSRGGKEPGIIRILAPSSRYRLLCDSRLVAFVSSPGETLKCSEEPLELSPQDGKTFPVGGNTVLFGIKLPSSPPQAKQEFFKMLLLEDLNTVLDADMQLPSTPLAPSQLRAEQPSLAWSSSQANSQSTTTVCLRLMRSLPAGTDASSVEAVLFVMPEGFRHAITSAQDVRDIEGSFPRAPDSPLQYDGPGIIGSPFFGSAADLRRVRIARDTTRRVPTGKYCWAMPVTVPAQMPRENVWRLALCSARTCSTANDTSAAVGFVIGGFALGETYVEKSVGGGSIASGTFRQHHVSRGVAGTVALLQFLIHLLVSPLLAA